MLKLNISLEKILPLLKNTFLPALVFGAGVIGFYAANPFPESSLLTLHSLFYVLSFAAFLILLYFDSRKPVFFILITVLSYILINYVKKNGGESYQSSAEYLNLCFFLPLNLTIFYFLPGGKLLRKENVWLLLSVFAQFAVAEKLSAAGLAPAWNFDDTPSSGLNSLSLIFFALMLCASFIRASISGSIVDTALFFAGFEIFLGFYYSLLPSALTIFFAAAMLSIAVAVVQDIYYSTYRDVLTGLAGRNAFIINAKNFPLKYSVGIVCIDDYEKLGQVFGRMGQNALTKMIAARITETEFENQVYRYTPDEFVIIFKKEDKNEGFDRLEKIRRAVASAEFMLGRRKKPIKLTVSCAVSEKKRSDANSVEVLVRAHKALQKTYKFTQNVTSKA